MPIAGERAPEHRELGRYLRAARKRARLTQTELGRRLNFSQGFIANWENGSRKPGSDAIPALARILELDPNDLSRRAGYLTGIPDVPEVDPLDLEYQTLPPAWKRFLLGIARGARVLRDTPIPDILDEPPHDGM